jgi:hypothetical protein
MPEYFKRVQAQQFAPTAEEKDKVVKGKPVLFENEPIRHGANGRFHVLLKVGELLTPVYDKQWIAREPDVHIYSEKDFQAAFQPKDGAK